MALSYCVGTGFWQWQQQGRCARIEGGQNDTPVKQTLSQCLTLAIRSDNKQEKTSVKSLNEGDADDDDGGGGRICCQSPYEATRIVGEKKEAAVRI